MSSFYGNDALLCYVSFAKRYGVVGGLGCVCLILIGGNNCCAKALPIRKDSVCAFSGTINFEKIL